MSDLAPFVSVEEKTRPILESPNRYEVGYQLSDGTYLWDTFQFRPEVPTSEDDLYHELTAGEVGKLDVVSFYYYGTVDLWWVIAIANNILNPLRIPAGTRLRIPSIDVVYREVI